MNNPPIKEVAEKLEADAIEIISRDVLKLAAGVQSGTAQRLVRSLVDAAVARVIEKVEAAKAMTPKPAQPASQATLSIPPRQTMGPRK